MVRRFRPFRSTWSLVLVLGAVLFTLAACDQAPPTDEGTCHYNEATQQCT